MSFNGTQGTYRGAAITKPMATGFIPQMWSSEVKRERDLSFVAARYIKMLSGQFTKGDRLNIPLIQRAAVNTKLPETPVNLQARTEGSFNFDITEYQESSFMIEDLVGIQSSFNLRSEYTKEAGYALARDVDNHVLGLRAVINGAVVSASTTYTYGQTTGLTQVAVATSSGNVAGSLNYSALLRAKLILDRLAVPDSDRVFIVSATQYNQLLAIDKFISMWYQSEKPAATGVVGTIFGIPVIMSTNLVANSATGYFNGGGAIAQPTPGVTASPYIPKQDLFTSLPTAWGTINGTAYTAQSVPGGSEVHSAILCHKDYAVMAMQKTPSVESSRETLYLADALVMSQVYGAKVYRPDHAVIIHSDGSIPNVN